MEREVQTLRWRHQERAFINPYLPKCESFPGRVFPGFDIKQEISELRRAIENKRILIELGSGSGGHLIELASRNPQCVAIGFELRFKRSVRTLEKAISRGVDNLLIARICATHFTKIATPGSVDGIFVNFPDPWEKKRQHKHRLLNANFLLASASILSDRGYVSVKTDHTEYFNFFLREISKVREFSVAEYSEDLHKSDLISENIETEFERMFCAQGKPVNYIKLVRGVSSF